ncbi:unnamed protein product (mitochondrion) [Plasmodiophora brassicae]|uniref:RING-type domain-containing protein n=1 Tax=Plasmodiophora brassicae TaxID=37360 RepID=A0A0G4J5Z2_PLABS|nr:hypothetical protein PBRA_009246 [Plasmodiophora brassicae]SPR01523.1 unnamed protein product [Plasmodiophora brassicae]
MASERPPPAPPATGAVVVQVDGVVSAPSRPPPRRRRRRVTIDAYQVALLAYEVAELVTSTVILSLYWDVEPCAALPVKSWILLYSARLPIRIPMTAKATYLESADDTVDDAAAAPARHRRTCNLLDACLRAHAFFMIAIGCFWVMQGTTCAATAPATFIYMVVLIGLVIVYVSAPVLVALAAFLCLPLLLIFVHCFGLSLYRASERTIKRLPRRRYRQEAAGDQTTCAICMTDFSTGDQVATLPCGHEFNEACIEQWLRIKRQCPVCRHDISAPMTSSVRQLPG